MQKSPPIVRRWVPFVAVAAANCINIPVMRQREVVDGVMVSDQEGNDLAKSKVSKEGDMVRWNMYSIFQVAAKVGISLVVLSRISLITPCMGEFHNAILCGLSWEHLN